MAIKANQLKSPRDETFEPARKPIPCQPASVLSKSTSGNSSRVVIFNHEVDILSSTPPFLSCSTMSNRQEMKKKLENIQMTIKDIDF